MVFKTEISVAELKAILELIQELAKKAGLKETLTKSICKRFNEKNFR